MFNLSGWIKLPRWLITDDVFGDSRLWHVYSYLLSQANYKPDTLRNGIQLDIGEGVISQMKLSPEMGIPRESFRNQLNRLEKLGRIERRVLGGRKGTLVRVLDYRELQGKEMLEGPENQPVNHSVNQPAKPADNPPQNKKKRIKEEKKKEVSLDDLEYPDGLDTQQVRHKLLAWHEYGGCNLSQLQLQSLLEAKSGWSAEMFCKAIDHSIASGWKSVNPAPDDGLIAKQVLPKKRQKSASELIKEKYDREANEAMKKARATDDPEQKKQYLDLVQDLAKKRDALETPSE
jgi:hypothetical protein